MKDQSFSIKKNVITNEREIIKLLNIFLSNAPILSSKEGQSGYGSNSRIIVVRNQYFQYYNAPIQNFVSGVIESLKDEKPKAKVNMKDIYQISFLPENKKKKTIISLTFPNNKMILVNKKSPQAKEKENQIIIWKFSFNFNVKQYIKDRNNELEEKMKEKEKEQRQKAFSILRVSEGMFPQKNKMNAVQEDDYDPELELNNNMEKIKKVKNEIEFKKELERKQKAREQYIKSFSKRSKEKDNDSQLEEENFLIRKIWKQYMKAFGNVIKFVDQEILNEECLKQQLVLIDVMRSIEEKVKILTAEFLNNKLIGWRQNKILFQDFQFYKGIWIKIGGKQLNQQFLVNSALTDIFYLLKDIKGAKFRIPLMFLIKYKGFKLLSMIDMPFSSPTSQWLKPLYKASNLNTAEDFAIAEQYQNYLLTFQKILNVKSDKKFLQYSQYYINEVKIPLGEETEIYEYNNNYEADNVMFNENFYYLINTKGIFPLDYNYLTLQNKTSECFLRPQLVAEYRTIRENRLMDDNQVFSQAFMHSKGDLDDLMRQDLKVKQLCEQVLILKIKQLAYELDELKLVIIDSYSIKLYMSQFGINSRYLGKMYQILTFPFLKQFFLIEMYARTIKNIYEDTVVDLVKSPQFFNRSQFTKKDQNVMKQYCDIHQKRLTQSTVDFLNLVFGKGEESNEFWNIILVKCSQKYRVQVTRDLKFKPGCLLFAVLWHCEIILKMRLDFKLFTVQKPFSIEDWVNFNISSKSFDLPSLKINKLIKKTSLLQDENDDEIKYYFPLLQVNFLQKLNRYGMNFQTQQALARMNNMSEGLEKPVFDMQYHPAEIPYYISNKTAFNFKKAIDIISFSLPTDHPLHVAIYNAYSTQFDQQLMVKSTIIAAIKGFGEFHTQTIKLYSKYCEAGLEQFEVKAKRSQNITDLKQILEQFFFKEKYDSSMNFAHTIISKKNDLKNKKLILQYIRIIQLGLVSSKKVHNYEKGLNFVNEYSNVVNTYLIKNIEDHHVIFEYTLDFILIRSTNKNYLYKMVLLAIKIQQDFETDLKYDSKGFLLSSPRALQIQIITGLINEYPNAETHVKWIQKLLKILKASYLYFNFLPDLFNNYQKYLNQYQNAQFKKAFGFLDLLLRYFGQKIFHDNLYQIG